MNSKRITPLSLFISISLAACAAEPKEVPTAQTASSPQPAASAVASSPPKSVAIGHDSAPQASQGAEAAAGAVKWSPPPRWPSKPASGMRAATYLIPAAQGDTDGAECAVFVNIQGGVDANIKRWIGQFEQPDGSSSESKAK